MHVCTCGASKGLGPSTICSRTVEKGRHVARAHQNRAQVGQRASHRSITSRRTAIFGDEADLDSIQESRPAAYDPSSNGSVENAARQIGGMIKTFRSCLEDRIAQRIPISHCASGWLVEHAAWLPTTRQRQSDGLTACQRARGRRSLTQLLCFGECCLYKVPEARGD